MVKKPTKKSSISTNLESMFTKGQKVIRQVTISRPFVQVSVTVKTVGLSAFVTFIIFIMIEVIWATEIAGALPNDITTIEQSIYWVELLLLTGIFSGFGISIIVSIIIGEQQIRQKYEHSQRRQMLLSALLAFILTFAMLTFTSFVSMITIYPDFLYPPGTNPLYAVGLVFISMLKTIAYFVIFIFPYPTEFWLITIAAYFVVLTVLFIILVPPSSSIDKKKRDKRLESLKSKKRKGVGEL